jgi:hydrogenase maturation protease
MALLPHLEGRKVLVLLDAIHRAGPCGQLQWLTLEEILPLGRAPGLSPHEGSAVELLQAALLVGLLPPKVWVGAITPALVTSSSQLSPPLAAALPQLLAATESFLRQLVQELAGRQAPQAQELKSPSL